MKKKLNAFALAIMMMLALLVGYANAQSDNKQPKAKASATSASVTPQAGPNLPVSGSGTADRIPKWLGNSSTSSVLGDSGITEAKSGKIGIGTTTPTSKLTVAGTIETTQGGIKFPDGSVQTSAASSSENPAQTAFQFSLVAPFAPSEGTLIRNFPVPAGKRLVIEYVSIEALLIDPTDVITLSELITIVGGVTAEHRIRPLRVEPNRGDFSIDKSVRIYADGGTVVTVAVDHSQANNPGFVIVAISGHLVNIP